MSAQTLLMIAPTVRQAIRISSVTADLEHCVANQATCSSKTYVCPAPCRAHGTAATPTPCLGAGHPRPVGLQPDRDRAQIQPSPPASALALVVAPTPPPAASAPSGRVLPRPDMGDQDLPGLELDVLDDRLLGPQHPTP